MRSNGTRRKPANPPERRLRLFKVATFLLVVAMAVSVGANNFTASSYRAAESELAIVAERSSRHRQQVESLHAVIEGHFAQIISNLDQQFIPLDRNTRLSLHTGQELCQSVATETQDPMQRASAYCTLGDIHSYRHNLTAAVEAYQKAAEAASPDSAQTTNNAHAYASNHLIGALAQLGREQEAYRLCEWIIQQLRNRIDSDTTVSYELGDELAFATRNLAVLSANLSPENAIGAARSHVETVGDLLSANPTELTLAERLIDGKYLLAGLLWRLEDDGKRTEAIAILEEVASMAILLRNDAERRSRSGDSIDYGKYKFASERARRELKLARSALKNPNGDRRGPAFWTRKNLYRGRRSIGTEILLNDVRLPAEFERQEAMIVKWSGREWQDDANVSLVRELATNLSVLLLVDDFESGQEARAELNRFNVDLANVIFLQVPANTVWVRDFGPLAVLGSEEYPIWIDYQHVSPDTRSNNDLLIERLGRLTGHRVIRGPLLLEGGNLITNGQGLMVCTKQLEDDNLNLGYSRENFRKRLRNMVGCQDLVVLENLKRERTGHVDWFVTFVAEDTVVVGEYDQEADVENAAILNRNAAKLQKIRLSKTGKSLRVVRIPMPPPLTDSSQGFGGTYTNVVFANGKLLVPQWKYAGDLNSKAIRIYQKLLPDWQIVPLDCTDMLPYAGAIHCATSNVAKMPVPVTLRE